MTITDSALYLGILLGPGAGEDNEVTGKLQAGRVDMRDWVKTLSDAKLTGLMQELSTGKKNSGSRIMTGRFLVWDTFFNELKARPWG